MRREKLHETSHISRGDIVYNVNNKCEYFRQAHTTRPPYKIYLIERGIIKTTQNQEIRVPNAISDSSTEALSEDFDHPLRNPRVNHPALQHPKPSYVLPHTRSLNLLHQTTPPSFFQTTPATIQSHPSSPRNRPVSATRMHPAPRPRGVNHHQQHHQLIVAGHQDHDSTAQLM
jgi:hypothetical protein